MAASPPMAEPNHYQLLGLTLFEDDPAVIRQRYAELCTQDPAASPAAASGPDGALRQRWGLAMLCLTDTRRKADYDASLGRRTRETGRQRTFEDLLLSRKLTNREGLERARRFAQATGVTLQTALVQQRVATADAAMPLYAESVGLPFVDWAWLEQDPALMDQVPATLARKHSLAPVMIEDGCLVVASPHVLQPDVEDELRLRTGYTIRGAICTPAAIHRVIERYYSADKAQAESRPMRPDGTRAPPPPPRVIRTRVDAETLRQRLGMSLSAGCFGFFATIFYYGFAGTVWMWLAACGAFVLVSVAAWVALAYSTTAESNR